MDYVAWVDQVGRYVADRADVERTKQVGALSLHIHPVAREYLVANDILDSNDIYEKTILAIQTALREVNGDSKLPNIHLERQQIEELRSSFPRWVNVFDLQLNPNTLIVLNSLNRLSEKVFESYADVEEVTDEELLADLHDTLMTTGQAFSSRDLDDCVRELREQKMILVRRWGSGSTYRSCYRGLVRTERQSVLTDQFIDEILEGGESEHVDLKRQPKVKSPKDKRGFAKDVVSLANSAGIGPRYLVYGVTNRGYFFEPESSEERELHRRNMESIVEDDLQRILNSRTLPVPVVKYHGLHNHRKGLVGVLEILVDVGQLPYRHFPEPTQRLEPNPLSYGIVGIRHGAINDDATSVEIAEMERRAEMHKLRVGR